ncbi:allergen Tha p 1-like [Phymastichus coffea]|uniref:allergen Tha p 1-like n=1 Tax=Phymastichus coffea TaxID=108790 RepID=UPI00273A87B7|nr:allergen Tha p 1-like [Phymastichus coffea]
MTAKNIRSSAWLVLLVVVCVEAGNFNITSRINEVLRNDSSMMFYVKCFLDQGPCSAVAQLFKRLIPEFMSTNCVKCSLNMKKLVCQMLFKMQEEKFTDLWGDFLVKYDPEEKYRNQLSTLMDSCPDESETDD